MCLGTFTKERKLHRKMKKKIFETQQQIKIYHPASSWCTSFSIIPENEKKQIVSPSFLKRSADKKGKH